MLVRRTSARYWAASCRWKDEDPSKPRPRTTGNTALGREAAARLSVAPRSHPRSARRVDELRTRPRVDAAAAHARPPVMTKLSLSPRPPDRTPKGGFKVRQRRLGRADTMARVDGEFLSVVASYHAGTPTAKDLLMRAVASTWPAFVATQDWSSPAASPPSSPATGCCAGSPLVKLRGVSLRTGEDNPFSPIRALDLGAGEGAAAPRPSSASRLHGWDADSEELQERAGEIFKLPESRREREWRRQEADRRRREAARAEREREEAERRRIELARQLE